MPPILAEIEGEVLIMTKEVVMYSDAKIVELFGIARGLEFFEFIFVPKSLFDVLFCIVFMSCPHPVLECVEFAERDSFLYSPNTEHHFDSFYIVGSVMLGVVYLFHIPYQIYSAKIEKTLRISQWGGMDIKRNST